MTWYGVDVEVHEEAGEVKRLVEKHKETNGADLNTNSELRSVEGLAEVAVHPQPSSCTCQLEVAGNDPSIDNWLLKL